LINIVVGTHSLIKEMLLSQFFRVESIERSYFWQYTAVNALDSNKTFGKHKGGGSNN